MINIPLYKDFKVLYPGCINCIQYRYSATMVSLCNKCQEDLTSNPFQFTACGHFLCRECVGTSLDSSASYLQTRGTRCTLCSTETHAVTLPLRCDLFQFAQAGEALKKKTHRQQGSAGMQNKSTPASWQQVIPPLLTLLGAETVYMSMTFLESSGWAKKEALHSMYTQTGQEVKKLSSVFHHLTQDEAEASQYAQSFSDNPKFFEVLLQQAVIYVQAKTQMMQLYRTMSSVTAIPPYNEFLSTIDTLLLRYESIFTHPFMQTLGSCLRGELAIAQCLFRTQLAMQRCQYKNSIFLLHQTRMLLEEFKNQAPNTSFKKGFNLSHAAVNSAPLAWLTRMWLYMVAKSTFYFSEPLRRSEEELGGDFKMLSSHLDPNYINLIEHFVSRSDAYNVALVFDSQGERIQSEGYVCPDPKAATPEPLTGLSAWPCVYAHPHRQGAMEHWPDIISLIMGHVDFLDACRHAYHHFDERRQVTYFIAKVEPELYIAVVYRRKRARQDKSAVSFVTGIANLLRNTTGFALLRAGSALQRLQSQKV